MIEAVNSAIAAAPLLRGMPGSGAETQSVPAGGSAQVLETVGSARGSQVPFISPYVHVNLNYNKAVLQLRDGETGDVVGQIPSDTRLAAQQRAAARLAEEGVVARTQANPLPGEEAAPAPDQAQASGSAAPPKAKAPETFAPHESPGTTGGESAGNGEASGQTGSGTSIDVLA